jgi:hypothetical protein
MGGDHMTRGGNTGRADRKRCRIMLASKLRFVGCQVEGTTSEPVLP